MDILIFKIAFGLSLSLFFIPKKWLHPFALALIIILGVSSSWWASLAFFGSGFPSVAFTSLLGNPVLLVVDKLSAFFILLINFILISGIVYTKGYVQPYFHQKSKIELAIHYFSFVLLQFSMLLVCMFRDGLAFLIVWEIMSISAFFLVIFESEKKETVKIGLQFLVQMHIGLVFLLAGFLVAYIQGGAPFGFEGVGQFFSQNQPFVVFFLLFIGFGIKAGFVPLHTWLPHAHPAAPSHISGIMSGMIVKLGIYGILRVAIMVQSDLLYIGEIIIVISIITGVFGILSASIHRDFKKMLAYCTIENIGIIGLGIGMFLMGEGVHNSTLMIIGLSGALLHVLNHSLFKSLLFFSIGSVYQQTHTRDMENLGGLIHTMPHTAGLFLFGSVAIGGLPPLNGFVSEFLIYGGLLTNLGEIGSIHATLLMIALASLALIGGLSMLTFTKTFGIIFLGSPRKKLTHTPHEVELSMRFPQYISVAIMLSIGLFPQLFFTQIIGIVTAILPSIPASEITAFYPMVDVIGTIGISSTIFLFLILVIYFVRKKLTSRSVSSITNTWGCGYVAPNPAMQYTGKSFSKSLGKLLNFLTQERKKYDEIEVVDVFPQPRAYQSHYLDIFENSIIHPLTNRLLHSLNFFLFIQNGRIQSYVLYGLFFILLVFFGTIFHLI